MNLTDFEIFKTNSYTPFFNNGKQYLLNKSPYLDIVLTDACNANCNFCIADLVHLKLKTDFTQLQQKVLFALNNMNVKEVLLLGGEPTISKNLLPAIKWLKSLNRLDKICMTTNGILLAKNEKFREEIFSSGLTHCNISFMNACPEKQMSVTNCRRPISIDNIADIYEAASKYGVRLRINCNCYRGSNDNLAEIVEFYNSIYKFCNSVKFSPLLKVDAFSVVDKKK